MSPVGLDIDTITTTVCETFLAREHTFATGAHLAWKTWNTTGATVSPIGLRVNTVAATVGESRLTGQKTGTSGADLARFATVATFSTTGSICL